MFVGKKHQGSLKTLGTGCQGEWAGEGRNMIYCLFLPDWKFCKDKGSWWFCSL